MEFNSRLIKAIETNDLVIFTGAGTSKSLNLPNWNELTKEVIKEIASDHKSILPYYELVDNGEITPLDALTNIEKYKGRILDYLSTRLSLSKDLDFSLQKKILSLSSKIITTNYDKAFEYANDKTSNVVVYNSNYQLSRLNNKESYIFKIHGDISTPDHCILFRKMYEDLYKSDNSYILELKKLISNKTILFIGFSLTDPYILEIFDNITQIYEGYNQEHFIITIDKSFDKKHFQNKIEPLFIQSYEHLPSLLDELNSYKKNITPLQYDSKKNEGFPKITPKLSILSSNPIDKSFAFKEELIVDSLAKYNIEIFSRNLSIENLQSIDSSCYLILLTHCVKNKFILEDEYLKSTQSDLREIDENIPSDDTRAIIILYEGEDFIMSREQDIKRVYIFINISGKKLKEISNKIVYHIITKHELPHLEKMTVLNELNLIFETFEKGIAVRNNINPIISKYLDTKVLRKFIGRKTDVENLIRKLIDLKYENKILSIKGSGGIGKTTIITKASIEISERGYYPKGVYFIPCQSIISLENFRFEISQCFEIASSIKVEDQIKENFVEKDRLIILDNYETLLNIEERDEILKLTSVICDYSSIVTTTRQILDLDFEDVYDLRNFTTDEGVELFKAQFPYTNPEQEKILRYDIVEDILNNNPLAIRLIAKGLPQNKDLSILKNELEANIFRNDNIEQIFERPEDINIEKSKSLYHSINYSYQKLSEKEKFAFEILSIFPDGIHLENLKKFSKASQKAKYKIDDKEIKSLDDKSLLENNNNFLRLQSIISRFSEHQFDKLEMEIKRELYTLAYEYNKFILSFLSNDRYFKRPSSLRLLDMHFNNFLKAIDYINLVDDSFEDKLDFLDNISYLFVLTNQPDQFLKKIENVKVFFKDFDYGTLSIDALKINSIYWSKNFDSAFTDLTSIFPFAELKNLDIQNTLQKNVLINAIAIYECEGYTYEILNMAIDKDLYQIRLEHKLYKLGFHKKAIKVTTEIPDETDFSRLEILNTSGSVEIAEIQTYIKSLFKKQSLEIAQGTYILSKKIPITEASLKKLVITNPYTAGIIKIMGIHLLRNRDEIIIAYKEALDDLYHIKFYYLEALLQFCKYMKSIEAKEFNEWHNKGYEMAKKYKFSYLVYLYEILINNNEFSEYDEEKYTSTYAPFDSKLNTYIDNFIKKRN